VCWYQFVSEDDVEHLLCLLHRFVVFLHGKEGKKRKEGFMGDISVSVVQ
jgi:hypothetical protein